MNDILHDDQRATEVIRRMRGLLKKAPFEQKQFDFNEVVEETIRFLSSLAVGRQFKLVSVIAQEALPILGDRILLQQVMLNLVVNGIDAMKDTPSKSRSQYHLVVCEDRRCYANPYDHLWRGRHGVLLSTIPEPMGGACGLCSLTTVDDFTLENLDLEVM